MTAPPSSVRAAPPAAAEVDTPQGMRKRLQAAARELDVALTAHWTRRSLVVPVAEQWKTYLEGQVGSGRLTLATLERALRRLRPPPGDGKGIVLEAEVGQLMVVGSVSHEDVRGLFAAAEAAASPDDAAAAAIEGCTPREWQLTLYRLELEAPPLLASNEEKAEAEAVTTEKEMKASEKEPKSWGPVEAVAARFPATPAAARRRRLPVDQEVAHVAVATAAADGQPTSAAAAPERMAAEQLPTGHTLRPREMGQHVAVVGDGWGGGTGGYEAVITEADELTFTVIAISGEARWKETHVLRQCCIAVSSGSGGEADGDSERPAGKVSPTVVGAAKRPRLRQ
mmetsp:Transcript_8702/g.18466  ORF Transcript_8702/g.18466 Transcript_8702/m.18466 type:complete len:340 (-) Transcript_8702:107-1126(-)